MTLTILGVVSVAFSLLSAICMAIPALKPRRLEIPVLMNDPRHVGSQGMPYADDTAAKFNKDLWASFMEQRRYASVGLSLLALGIAFQLLDWIVFARTS